VPVKRSWWISHDNSRPQRTARSAYRSHAETLGSGHQLRVEPRCRMRCLSRVNRTACALTIAAVFLVGGCGQSYGAPTSQSVTSTNSGTPAQPREKYERRSGQYAIRLTSERMTPLVARVRERLHVADAEAIDTGRPRVPIRCFPEMGFRLHVTHDVTHDGVEQIAQVDQDGFAVAPGRNGFSLAETFGPRTSDGSLLNGVVVRLSDDNAAVATLFVGGQAVDRAPVRDGWAVLLYPTKDFSFLSDVGVAGGVAIADSTGPFLVANPSQLRSRLATADWLGSAVGPVPNCRYSGDRGTDWMLDVAPCSTLRSSGSRTPARPPCCRRFGPHGPGSRMVGQIRAPSMARPWHARTRSLLFVSVRRCRRCALTCGFASVPIRGHAQESLCNQQVVGSIPTPGSCEHTRAHAGDESGHRESVGPGRVGVVLQATRR
jgi:hypothetical protein